MTDDLPCEIPVSASELLVLERLGSAIDDLLSSSLSLAVRQAKCGALRTAKPDETNGIK